MQHASSARPLLWVFSLHFNVTPTRLRRLACPVSVFGGGYIMKGNMEPRDLLCAYVERRSEAAFAQLVELHLDLVYSAALRLVRDADLAKDVSQAVFLRLARKAGSVRDGNALAGWLYRAACFEAKPCCEPKGAGENVNWKP
jgi:hypothetical protein